MPFMKITSINFVDVSQVPKSKARNTQRTQDVQKIVEKLAQCPTGKAILIEGSEIARFEAYAFQKALRARGQKVVVVRGPSGALYVRKLSDAEWQDILRAQTAPRAERKPRGKK